MTEPQPTIDMVNAFCAAAGAPGFVMPVDRALSATPLGSLGGLVPRRLRPSSIVTGIVRRPAAQTLLDQTIGRLGIPSQILFVPQQEIGKVLLAQNSIKIPAPSSGSFPVPLLHLLKLKLQQSLCFQHHSRFLKKSSTDVKFSTSPQRPTRREDTQGHNPEIGTATCIRGHAQAPSACRNPEESNSRPEVCRTPQRSEC